MTAAIKKPEGRNIGKEHGDSRLGKQKKKAPLQKVQKFGGLLLV